MGIQDKNKENNIKSKIYPKSKTLRELENLTMIDLYIVIKMSVPCSGRKSTSEKMSVDSIQKWPPRAYTHIESVVPQLSKCLKFEAGWGY